MVSYWPGPVIQQQTTVLIGVLGIVLGAAVPSVTGQTVTRFPQSGNLAYQPYQPGTGSGTAGGGVVYTPPAGAATTPLPGGAPAPSALGSPSFDPYSSNPGVYTTPPAMGGTTPVYGTGVPPGGPPPGMPGAVPNVYGGTTPSAVPYGQPYGQPYNGQPPALFPNGFNTPQWTMPATRFLTPRVRYTWVRDGGGPNDLGINDFDSSAVMSFPNFLFSNQPLLVTPSFSLHLWSGPRLQDSDLPAKAYSAFLDFGWATDPTQQLGGEIGVRMGAFTDFDTFNTNSWRLMGQGLFRLRTTPTVTLRGGVAYINRNKLKLLPAFGLLWTPNSQTRFDIFFPKPKLSQRLTTIGNQDVWWYVAGEYGGGAWTINRADGTSDRMDINDIRLILGAEWGQPARMKDGGRIGFIELGWVTNREIIYVVDPSDNVSVRDSFMLRTGFNY